VILTQQFSITPYFLAIILYVGRPLWASIFI